MAHAVPQQGLCLTGRLKKPEGAARAFRAESKPCRSASRACYSGRTAMRYHK